MAQQELISLLTVSFSAHKIPGVDNMNIKRDLRKQAALEKQIDENLKRVYEEDVQKDIPDRFHLLLEKLREQGQAS